MIKAFIFIGILFVVPFTTHAATCAAGYYLSNGECLECNPNSTPYYCPGDDIRHPCPTTDTDYNQFGYILRGGSEAVWADRGAKTASACHCDMDFIDEYGNIFLLENSFNGTNYWGNRRLWWFAVPGFYLSKHQITTYQPFYYGVLPCTNAPTHAHYTAAGTPDTNNCPWECDDGYGQHGDECVPLCTAGAQHIQTGNSRRFNLYPVRYSTPAVVIKYNTTTCFGVLAPGAAQNTINIRHGDKIYHAEN